MNRKEMSAEELQSISGVLRNLIPPTSDFILIVVPPGGEDGPWNYAVPNNPNYEEIIEGLLELADVLEAMRGRGGEDGEGGAAVLT